MPLDKTSQTSPLFTSLLQQKYILLKTFRKSGDAVATPVWFTQEDETLYVTTTANAGKVKRIKNNPHVLLSPCDSRGMPLGTEIAGQARMVATNDYARVNALLAKKFGFLYQVFMFVGNLRKQDRAYVEIVPEK